ncbi:hypothetical protein [Brevundimonas intermedia]|uniref:hypothetical protein n=1 Tax=Brevundimonas intermedia TaxID=74315 RepID=UPI00320AB069
MLYAVFVAFLFGGAELISTLTGLPDDGLDNLSGTNPFFLGGLMFVVLSGEALLLTVAPIEIARRLWRQPLIGALIGILVYAVGIHWSKGWQSILLTGWIALVIAAAYLLQLRTSRWLAVLQALGLKWAFAAFALFTIFNS